MNDTNSSNPTLTERLAEFERHLAKATTGSWFWSARTLRSEIMAKDEEGDYVESIPDILSVDSDKCVYASNQADAALIEGARDLATIATEQAALLRECAETLKEYALIRRTITNLGTGESHSEFAGQPALDTLAKLKAEGF